jgi:hypothetical protein
LPQCAASQSMELNPTMLSKPAAAAQVINSAITFKPAPRPDFSKQLELLRAQQNKELADCTAQSGTLQLGSCILPPPPPAPVTAAPVQSVPPMLAPAYAPMADYSGNGYTWGQCTWYVKNRRPDIPNNWGNAGGWFYAAQSMGWPTGYSPRPGAIGEESGHVVYVESVNGDGTVNISEMNWAGGVGQTHYRTTSASEFVYIY